MSGRGKNASSSGSVPPPTIKAEGATINSGYCTGNTNVLEHIKHINEMKVPLGLGEHKGTFQLYNVESGGQLTIPKIHNTGAFSGYSHDKKIGDAVVGNNRCGAVDEGQARRSTKDSGSKATTVSNVIGTLQSFNAGIPPGKHCRLEESNNLSAKLKASFHDANTGKMISGINPPHEKDGSSGLSKGSNAGTGFSFNVVGEGSSIDMQNATINSGYCSGENNFYDCKFLAGEYMGTKESFNAMSGCKIHLKSACIINSGGYAGNSK